MNQSPVAAGAMIVGLLMMFAGYWSESALPTSATWTDQQAEEFQKASVVMHGASYGKSHDHSKEHSHDGPEPDRSSPEYLAAKAAFDKTRADRDRAEARRSWIKYGIIFTGVLISGVGIVIVAIEKMKADEGNTQRRKPHKL
jgi:hypothetical protein